MDQPSKYGELGVDSLKKGIELFTAVDEPLYKHAFCRIYRHPKRPDVLVIKHPDGVGSKSVQRYLHFKETGDLSVFEGDSQDLIEMNFGDVMCCGLDPLFLTDYLAIGHRVPKACYIKAINKGFAECRALLSTYGIRFAVFAGGETADLPDQEQTYDIAGDVYAEGSEQDAITGDLIAPGDIIIGVRSGGRAIWEDKRNSGIMSNGLLLGRHCLMSPEYEEKYPEIKGKEPHTGKYRIDDFSNDLGMAVGDALISPTRHFSIVISELLKNHRKSIHGLALNTGGGQTKCLRLGENIHYVKDFTRYRTPDHDPLFYLVQQESGESWSNMFRGFNMGYGLDVIADPLAERGIRETVKEMGILAWPIGHTEESDGKSKLTINSRFGKFNFTD